MLQAAAEGLMVRAGESVVRMDRAQPGFISAHPELSLRNLKDARNVVAHGYDIVDIEALWEIMKDDMPGVIERVTVFLAEQSGSSQR